MRPFSGISANRPLAPSYDVVVIGAGIGGLICANLLARAGLQVLLVEQHYLVGGYCSTFRRRGYTFDAASHFYPLLGNRSTLTGGLLSELGIETKWIKMDPVDQFHLPDGTNFAVPAEFGAYLALLREEFPDEREPLDRFFRLARKLYLLGALRHFRGVASKRLDPYEKLTVRDAIDQHFQSPRLKLLLTADCAHWGSPPCRTSFVFDSMLRLSYFLGNYYPEGGSQVFADELAQRFEERGGHILLKSSVVRILVENRVATAIELETGPRRSQRTIRLPVGSIVSNADLRQTIERFLPEECLDEDYRAGINRLRPTYPCFMTHLGVQGVSTDVLQQVHGYHWNDWNSDRVGHDSFRFKLFVPTLYEPRLAPPGGHVLVVQKVLEMDYDAVDDWSAHKAAVEQSIMRDLQRLIPGIDSKVAVKLSASAQTSFRFTRNYQGAMLGWEMSPEQLGDGRPAIQTPVENLCLAGQWTRPGGGITPVVVSAMQAANHVVSGNAGAVCDLDRERIRDTSRLPS